MTEPPQGEPGLQPFQVDLRGVVDLLSRHIYSSPRVYLRELLQNGRDAITARGELEGATAGWGIRITPVGPGSPTFVLRDDGIGLGMDEVGELLSTVGRSSKRDIFDLPRSDYLGQFGIGLLSCFMVADHILIRSRSARGTRAVEWQGNADGTFSVREIDDELPIGTSVQLTPRADQAELLGTETVLSLASSYGEFLPVPIAVDLPNGGTESVTRTPEFALPFDTPSSALLQYGHDLVGVAPFDVIELSVPATGTRGTAFVLPYSPPPGARQANRVYLGRMLLGERLDDVLPDWAFFVRVAIDSTGLHPTASREGLVDDEELEYTRKELGSALRRWIMELGLRAPHRLGEFVRIHHVALKALVLHDGELAGFITKWLSVETSVGTMTIDTLVRRYPLLRYAETVDEFRQIASFARGDAPVINGGYLYDSEIVRMLPSLFDGIAVERVNVVDELDHLAIPPLDDRSLTVRLEERASAVLAAVDCTVVLRGIDQAELPAIYVADPEVFRSLDRRRAKNVGGGLWGGVIGRVDDFVAGDRVETGLPDATARLCLNWNNRVVRMLARTEDDAVFSRSVQLLYVQALLAGHRPLTVSDRSLMTAAMSDLILLSVGLDDPTPEELS